jgi:hypothetical protein
MIKVVRHKGHSGKSVYEWRVYRIIEASPGRVIKSQLGKYRSQELAEKAASHYRSK